MYLLGVKKRYTYVLLRVLLQGRSCCTQKGTVLNPYFSVCSTDAVCSVNGSEPLSSEYALNCRLTLWMLLFSSHFSIPLMDVLRDPRNQAELQLISTSSRDAPPHTSLFTPASSHQDTSDCYTLTETHTACSLQDRPLRSDKRQNTTVALH